MGTPACLISHAAFLFVISYTRQGSFMSRQWGSLYVLSKTANEVPADVYVQT